MTTMDSQARDLVQMFFAQCEPIVADARAQWRTTGELDRITVSQLRLWAVDRAVYGAHAPYGAGRSREVQEWQILDRWLADNDHRDLGQ
ncbi:hypothetical protein ACIBL8_25835 [Streptomyces sp. NPDC050523]|uniref:hypothetical protein n=1 Tax=Streptomyces sp. NPDC050523 TaxID=3365622 RepID=UPI00379FBB1E